MHEPTTVETAHPETDEATAAVPGSTAEALGVEDLIEDVSIDGMCGVY